MPQPMNCATFALKAEQIANGSSKASAMALLGRPVPNCQDRFRTCILNGYAVTFAMKAVAEAKKKGLDPAGNDSVTKSRLSGFRELMEEIHQDHEKRYNRGEVLEGYAELCQEIQDFLPYLIPETEQMNFEYETRNLDPAFSA